MKLLAIQTSTERETIIRAQRHGWRVAFVGDKCIILERKFLPAGAASRPLFVWPDGRIDAGKAGKEYPRATRAAR